MGSATVAVAPVGVPPTGSPAEKKIGAAGLVTCGKRCKICDEAVAL
jgi:hypothetical protein